MRNGCLYSFSNSIAAVPGEFSRASSLGGGGGVTPPFNGF